MNSTIFYEQWKLALIDSDARKSDKLCSIIKSTIYHCISASSFMDHLKTMADARECLILVVPVHLIKDLPTDIEEKIHRLHVYGQNGQNEFQSFDDVCLHLSNLIIAQCTEQSSYFRRSNENGLARVRAQESIIRSKDLIRQLEDLCDDIDEKLLFGQQAES